MPSRLLLLKLILFTGTAGLSPARPLSAADEDLLTIPEQTRFEATCTSQQCDTFVRKCAERSPHIERITFGATVEDREMSAAVLSHPTAALTDRDERLRILVIGNIHSGECAGKEALLMLLREISAAQDHPWLQNAVIVLAPNYNADANDKMAVNNRPGQVGPVRGMGRRANAQGFDLNRDFMKLESPEARALVRLMTQFDPHLFIDCHTTNGSRHRYALTYDIPHNPATSLEIRDYLRGEMMPRVTSRLQQESIETFFYGNFDDDHRLWVTYGYEPRYSTEYYGLRGRLAILSEAYSYISFKQRIRASYSFVSGCIEDAIQQRDTIRRLTAEFDRSQRNADPESAEMSLAAEIRPFRETTTILGYGAEDEPVDYECTFLGRYESTVNTDIPDSWLIPESLTQVVTLLQNHGIELSQLDSDLTSSVEIDRINEIRRSPRAFQRHHLQRVNAARRIADMQIPKGTWKVPANQPLGRLAGYLLEAQSCDGIVTWNLIDDRLAVESDYPIWRIPRGNPVRQR